MINIEDYPVVSAHFLNSWENIFYGLTRKVGLKWTKELLGQTTRYGTSSLNGKKKISRLK